MENLKKAGRTPNVSDEELIAIISHSESVTDVLRKITPNGVRAGTFKYERIARLMRDNNLVFTNGNCYFNKNIGNNKL